MLSTSYALVQLLDLLDLLERRGAAFGLAGSSCVVDTGGYKGVIREVPRPEVIALAGRRPGLSPGRCVGAYGMSELSSQWWTPDLRRAAPRAARSRRRGRRRCTSRRRGPAGACSTP